MFRSGPLAKLVTVLAALCAPGLAQQDFFTALTAHGGRAAPSYAAAVPAPASFFGYELGTRYTTSGDLVRYAEAVAKASDRVQVHDYGRSAEGRRLIVAYVSTAANLARRSAIEARNVGLTRGAKDASDDLPLTVLLAMGIHGDEASGGEAAAALLYHFAAGQGAEIEKLLERTLIVIDPAQNPDGRDRFVTLVTGRASRSPQAEALAYDHHQPWPGGRSSHDLFDLNRDWFLQNQDESRARVALFRQLMPQVVVDVHEMGANESYFFSAPPADPLNPRTSEQVKARWQILGDGVADAFDRHHWSYFTGDLFPLDYPGFGGSFPLLCGAVSMTFEQAAPSGPAIRRNDGSTLLLRDAVLHHATACLATVETAAARATDLFRLEREHFAAQAAEAARDELPFFLFTPRRDPDRTARLQLTLQRCGIKVDTLQSAWTADVNPLAGGVAKKTTLPAGTLVVSTAQPFRPLILTLLDPRNELAADFVRGEAERLERREGSEIYDVTAWNLPLLFGVESFRASSIDGAVLDSLAESRRSGTDSRPAKADPITGGPLLFPGHRLAGSRLLAALLEADVRVRVAGFSFTASGRNWGPGTLVVMPEPNAEDGRYAAAPDVAARLGLAFDSVPSARTEIGFDLGSRRVRPVIKPSIVVAFGPPTDAGSAGAIRWFLETELGVAHTCVSVERPLRQTLDKANVLILPDGPAEAWERALPADDVKGFLSRGGTIVAVKGAVQYLARKEVGVLGLTSRKAADTVAALHGPIVHAMLDTQGWLGWGLDADLSVQVRSRVFYDLPDRDQLKTWAALDDGDGLLLSGQLPPPKKDLIRGTPLVLERTARPGLVIGFTEDPTLRGASPGLFKLFANAILFGPTQL